MSSPETGSTRKERTAIFIRNVALIAGGIALFFSDLGYAALSAVTALFSNAYAQRQKMSV